MSDKKDTEVPINGLYDDEDQPSETSETDAAGDGASPGGAAGHEPELSLSQEELTALCKESVCPGCDVFKEAENVRLRALADAENVKKRLLRESEDLKKFAGESVLADLLPVLDNLDLALAHTGNLDSACKNFVIGVDMTRKLFLDAVKNHGLVQVEAARGAAFNPEIHEAVGTVEEDGLGDNCIAQVMQGGYLLKGRLLRPAKVMVNKA